MSQENVELIQRFEKLMTEHEAHRDTSGDYAPVLELVDPEIVVRIPPGAPHTGEWVGHDGLIEMMNKLVSAREVVDFETQYLDAGDIVVVLTSLSHRMSPDADVMGPFRMALIYYTRNGKVSGIDVFYEDTSFFN
jgi:hypothetical protein